MNFLTNIDSPEAQTLRYRMVSEQIAARGVREERVLEAFRRVPRHLFLPSGPFLMERAYADSAQGIGSGQTISQPYVVALMTEALHLQGTETILEIGAGSGYQTAIFSLLCKRIIAIERHANLAERAGRLLNEVGVTNAEIRFGDGSNGLPSEAPYDAILVAAVAPEVPTTLLSQLTLQGRLILPIGEEHGPQRLLLFTKTPEGIQRQDLGHVAFVPLIGASGFGLPADLGDMDI